MSTRCMIQLEGHGPMLYQHHDGYPTTKHGVLAWLEPFVKDFMAKRGWDPCYMLARMAQVRCNTQEGFTGFGISDRIHGDAEFVYVVHEDGTVTYNQDEE